MNTISPCVSGPLTLLALLSMACGGAETNVIDSGDPQRVHAMLEISSPMDGSVYLAGEAVFLQASVKDELSDDLLQASDFAWSAEGWGGYEGESGTVSDLPSGSFTLRASASYDGHVLEDSVQLVVEEPASELVYTGDFVSWITITYSGFDIDDTCMGSVEFTVGSTGLLQGAGSCRLDVLAEYYKEWLSFDMTGQVADGQVDGALLMQADGETAETPFQGQEDPQGIIDASFDETHQSGEYTLRLWGSFQAWPQ